MPSFCRFTLNLILYGLTSFAPEGGLTCDLTTYLPPVWAAFTISGQLLRRSSLTWYHLAS